MTLARLKLPEVPRFIHWGKPVEELVRDHPATTLALAAMRPPRTVSTFSVWRSQREMLDMVRGQGSAPDAQRHARAMVERSRKDFHYEFTTLRFRALAEHGTWQGRSDIVPKSGDPSVLQIQDAVLTRHRGEDPRVPHNLAHSGREQECAHRFPDAKTGGTSTSRARQLLILGALVGIDLITKAAATSLLYKNTPVDVDASLQFVLRTNPSGLGTWALAANVEAASPDRLAASLAYLALAIGLQLLRRAEWSRWTKTLTAFTVFGAAFALGLHLAPQLGSMPSPAFVALSKVGPAALLASLWWMAAPGLWRTTTTLFTAAALGNLLGLVLPPHEAIDFIYSKPLSTVFRQGVVNIADLYFDAGILCLLVLLGRTYLARLRVGSTRAHGG